jgi:hypothetical protein
MLGSEVLDVAIGLILLFILLSTLASTVREMIEAVMRSRGRTLEIAIEEMLGPDGAQELYRHPLIRGLYRGDCTKTKPWSLAAVSRRRRLPSYIPDALFTLAAYNVAIGTSGAQASKAFVSTTEARQQVEDESNPASSQVKQLVTSALEASQFDTQRAMQILVAQYQGAMDRASGWYRRQTFWIILAIAAMLTIVMNVDAIDVTQHLYRNRGARDVLVSRATKMPQRADSLSKADVFDVRGELAALDLPIGWPTSIDSLDERTDFARRRLLGWIVTILSISLGAPFWFDVLNKLMVIRSTVKPREKSQEEGSEDRASNTKATPSVTTWTPLPVAQGSVAATTATPAIGPGAVGELHANASRL